MAVMSAAEAFLPCVLSPSACTASHARSDAPIMHALHTLHQDWARLDVPCQPATATLSTSPCRVHVPAQTLTQGVMPHVPRTPEKANAAAEAGHAWQDRDVLPR